jgi:MFS family permease
MTGRISPMRADQSPHEQPIPWVVWRLAAVIVFGAFTSGLDASVVNVGAHHIAHDLHTDLITAQWVSTGYLLALGVSLPAVPGWVAGSASAACG